MQTSAPQIDLMPLAVSALDFKQKSERRLLYYRTDELREIARQLQNVPVRVLDLTFASMPRTHGDDGLLSDDVMIIAGGEKTDREAIHEPLIRAGLRLYGSSENEKFSVYEHTKAKWMLSITWHRSAEAA